MSSAQLPLPQLAERRTHAGISQRQLATTAGVSYQTIRRLEAGGDSGTLPLGVIHNIATRLNTTIGSLLEGAPTPVTTAQPDNTTLSANQARLLRRIDRGEDIRRNLARPDRELTLPALMNTGHVELDPAGRPQLTPQTHASLHPQTLARTLAAALDGHSPRY